MTLLKDWNNYESDVRKAREFLRDWYKQNLIYKKGTQYGSIDNVFGLAYTSSGEYAALWNTNSQWVYKQIPEYAFRGVAISDTGIVVVVLYSTINDFENESLFIPIGKL